MSETEMKKIANFIVTNRKNELSDKKIFEKLFVVFPDFKGFFYILKKIDKYINPDIKSTSLKRSAYDFPNDGDIIKNKGMFIRCVAEDCGFFGFNVVDITYNEEYSILSSLGMMS